MTMSAAICISLPIKLVAGLVLVIATSGCASRPLNAPLEQLGERPGYRPQAALEERANNDPTTFFALSFSGGGTRAAAFSFGILEELDRHRFTEAGETRRLIEEVDVSTGVSGGSFTALSYALFGRELFEQYESRFLKRDVQGALLRRSLLNPVNWFRQMSGNFGRSEIAAEYYDEILFEEATFNDLVQSGQVVAIATATVLSTGARLAFDQNDFDLLCSDLGAMRLSRAAAASSAVPVALSPVTLTNYAGLCDYQYPAWVRDARNPGSTGQPSIGVMQRIREMERLQDSTNHPFIHLVDGGVADNLGVRGVLEALEELSFSERFREKRLGDVRRIVLIVVNAQASNIPGWDRRESPPNTFQQTLQSSGVPISLYTSDTVELMKKTVEEAAAQRQVHVAEAQLGGLSREEAEALYPVIEMVAFDISFDGIVDEDERSYFQSLPTSFSLPDEAVDRLREIAGRLLRQSPGFQRVLAEWGASAEPGQSASDRRTRPQGRSD